MYFLVIILSLINLILAEIDPDKDQLVLFKEEHPVPIGMITTSNGAPVYYDEATSSINKNLIHNAHFMGTITHLDRERTPERVVHGRGSGAFGYFEVTNGISSTCKADFLSEIGKKTNVSVRFSKAIGERGTDELGRDLRGFAIKFYTKEGNFDIVGANIPVFFAKDPLYFASIAHANGRNAATNLKDANMFWDIVTLRPESLHLFLRVFADAGIPASYRLMPGYGVHLYEVVNKNEKKSYVKFHLKSNNGVQYFSSQEAQNVSLTDPDYLTRDLYQAIGKGNYPSWTVYVQILSEADVKKLGSRAYDVTRVISTKKFPLQKIGKLVLNRNPKNYFAEIEQLAFSPAHLVPGILGASDKIFEARSLTYKDAHMYRLGVNANKIPINCPYQAKTYTYYRDGVPPVKDNEKDIPNYYPNSFNGPIPAKKNKTSLTDIVESDDVDNYDQVSDFYENLQADEKDRLINNLLTSLSQTTEIIQNRAVQIFKKINSEFGNRISNGLITIAK